MTFRYLTVFIQNSQLRYFVGFPHLARGVERIGLKLTKYLKELNQGTAEKTNKSCNMFYGRNKNKPLQHILPVQVSADIILVLGKSLIILGEAPPCANLT